MEAGFAIALGLFVAHADLIRNAMEIHWLPLREVLALFVFTLLLRLLLAGMLHFDPATLAPGGPITSEDDGRFLT